MQITNAIKILFSLSIVIWLFFSSTVSANESKHKIEVWTDNWFAAFLNGEALFEDSVPITTERSFNEEVHEFSANQPFFLAFILKDFKENDTGLEYIGTRRQQMGDGGFITQITKLDTGEVVAVSNKEMLCKVIHKAPLDADCEKESDPVAGEGKCLFNAEAEPENWKLQSFDDSNWTPATEHSESAVSPKFGYDNISWDASAKLIWSEDLEKDNTVLCRLQIE